MKIGIITGSYPPDVCGVSDYTERLELHLRSKGVSVHIYTGKDWQLRSAPTNIRELVTLDMDILHMQYPATGYGWKLGPQLLSVALPMVLTLHEASQSHVLRKCSLFPFSFRVQKIIFTNEYEREYVQQFAPWIKGRSHLIPIGNNVAPIADPVSRATDKITYFGLIRPEKGLSEVMELARLLKASSHPKRVRIIGQVMPGQEAYYMRLRAENAQYDVEWQVGLEGQHLSCAVASSDIAYLPFPDGASERRSSLIALLANGSAVITTKGPHTPLIMREAVHLATSPKEAYDQILDLERNEDKKTATQYRARIYAEKFAWDNIAAQHIAIYEQLLRQKASSTRK